MPSFATDCITTSPDSHRVARSPRNIIRSQKENDHERPEDRDFRTTGNLWAWSLKLIC